jgi:hypothetical protein
MSCAVGVLAVYLAPFRKPPDLPMIAWGAMTNPTHDQKKLEEYRERAATLHDLSKGVEERMGKAAESGVIQAAREALGELKLKTKEFEDFRETLTPAEIFVARYNVEVVNDHTVSCVIPKGVSRIEILEEAQAMLTDRDLIWPAHLAKWTADPKFATEATTSERICIDGHVPNSVDKTRAQQEALVGKENLSTLDDLAVAFGVNWIATGEPLFGWHDESLGWSYVVRAAGRALFLSSFGLHVDVIVDARSDDFVAVSSRAPELKKLDS